MFYLFSLLFVGQLKHQNTLQLILFPTMHFVPLWAETSDRHTSADLLTVKIHCVKAVRKLCWPFHTPVCAHKPSTSVELLSTQFVLIQAYWH